MFKHYSKSKVFSVLNESSGEFVETEFVEKVKYKPNGKQGWTKMYRTGYDEVMMELSSRLEMAIFIYIRDSFTRSASIAVFNQTKMADKLSTTRSTVNRLMKKLEKLQFIRKIDDKLYKMNPYVFAPYHADLQSLQKEWDDTSTDKSL